MKPELDKKDLIALIKESYPKYSEKNNPLIDKFGSFSTSNDRWEWSSITLQECTEEELYKIYKLSEDSCGE